MEISSLKFGKLDLRGTLEFLTLSHKVKITLPYRKLRVTQQIIMEWPLGVRPSGPFFIYVNI